MDTKRFTDQVKAAVLCVCQYSVMQQDPDLSLQAVSTTVIQRDHLLTNTSVFNTSIWREFRKWFGILSIVKDLLHKTCCIYISDMEIL